MGSFKFSAPTIFIVLAAFLVILGSSQAPEGEIFEPSVPHNVEAPESSELDTATPPAPPEQEQEPVVEPAASNRKVVGYFTNWAQYRTQACPLSPWKPDKIPGNLLTHVNYAFAMLNSQYQVVTFEWNDEEMYGTLNNQVKARFPHLKTLLSLGGWTFNDKPETRQIFSNMASSAKNRAAFINSAIAFVRKYKFDGIDIDWEYPGDPDRGGRPEDKPNFTAVLRELRAAINAEKLKAGQSRLLLTIANSANAGKVDQYYELSKIHAFVDWINLMTYDMHGSWEQSTGAHTALTSRTDNLSGDAAISKYLKAGVPSTKIVMGLATYGRTWTLSDPKKYTMGSPANAAGRGGRCTQSDGFLAYYEIKEYLAKGALSALDTTTKTKYAWTLSKHPTAPNQWISYDDTRTMNMKLDYIISKKLGGSMIWALDLDTSNFELIGLINRRMRT